MPAIEGANAPYEDWLRQCFYPLPNSNKKRTSHERFVYTSGVRFKKPQLPRFGVMILELKTGRKRNKGSKRIDIRESQSPLSIPNTKRTSHKRGSLALPEFVPKNRGFPIWRNDFGAKNGAQAKQRVEAYLTYARVFVIAQQLVFSPKAFAKSAEPFCPVSPE